MKRFTQFITEEKLTKAEKAFLDDLYWERPHGLLWSLLDNPERRIGNSLAKRGYVRKSKADTKQKGVAYFLTGKGEGAR